MLLVHRKVHRYCGRRFGGHRQIASSVQLPEEDERLLVQRSDLAGDDTGSEVAPYLTAYPLGSGVAAFSRTEYDAGADRTGAVRTLTLLVNASELPHGNPFFLWPLLKDGIGGDASAELEEARAHEGALPLEPIPFEPSSGPLPQELLAPLAALGEDVLLHLLSALEGALPVAVLGARDPEGLAHALVRLVPEQGRVAHAVCTGALAPRAFTRLALAPREASERFLARAASERDLALIDVARPHAWNVAPTALAEHLLRWIKGGEEAAALDLVARASRIAAYDAVACLGEQLRWEQLSRSPTRAPEESVELANHLRRRGAREDEVLACYREVLRSPPRERVEWAMNILTGAWLPLRLELSSAALDPEEDADVLALVKAALSEDRLEQVATFLERGGARLYPTVRAATVEHACAFVERGGGASGPDALASLVAGILADAVEREGHARSASALASLLAPRAERDGEALGKAVRAIARVSAGDRPRAAFDLATAVIARGEIAAHGLALVTGLVQAKDRGALARVAGEMAKALAVSRDAAPLAPIVRVLPDEPSVFRAVARALLDLTPRRAAASPEQTGALAAPVSPRKSAGAEETGAFARSDLKESAGAEETGAIDVSALRGKSATASSIGDKRTGRGPALGDAGAPATGRLAEAIVAGVGPCARIVSRELEGRTSSERGLRAYRHAIALLAAIGRRTGDDDLARAGRTRAVELALARGDAAAVSRRAVLRSRNGALAEAAWLLERLRSGERSLVPDGAAREIARALATAASRPGLDVEAARRLASEQGSLTREAFVGGDLAGLAALVVVLGDSSLPASALDAAASALARASAGQEDRRDLEAALALPERLRAAVAERLARALDSGPERLLPWLAASSRVGRTLAPGVSLERLLDRASAALDSDQAPTAESAERVLARATELFSLVPVGARARRASTRAALVRIAVRSLDVAHEPALAVLARELSHGERDAELEAQVAERLSQAVVSGKAELTDAARLGLPVLQDTLSRTKGGFNLRVQNGLEALAAKAASEGETARPVLLTCVDHIVALGDKELGSRVARRIHDALGARADEKEWRELLAGLAAGKPRRA